jgi:hypothetical protein
MKWLVLGAAVALPALILSCGGGAETRDPGNGGGGGGGIDAGRGDARPDRASPDDAAAEADAPDDAIADACARAEPACVGDGVADDTNCLQALLDAGQPVVLPPGKKFAISKALQLHDGASLEGCGSTITLSQEDVVLRIAGNGIGVDAVKLVYAAGAVNAGIVDLAAGATHFTLTNSDLSGVDVAGVHINAPDIAFVTIRGNRMSGMHCGILFNTTNWKAADLPVLAHHPHDVVIDENTITGVTADAVEVNSAVYAFIPHNSGKPGVAAHDITITKNHLESPAAAAAAGFCLGIAGAFDVRVTDNDLTQCKYAFIHLEDTANHVVIENNRMKTVIGALAGEDDPWGPDTAGIIMLDSDHISILGNELTGSPSRLIDQTYDPEGHYDHDIVISGNTLDQAMECIFVGGTSSEDLATLIGPSDTDGKHWGGNEATHCTPTNIVPNAMGVTVTGNDF